MQIDPLSDVLATLKPETYVAGGIDLGGDWSIQFEAHAGIKCYACVSGAGWLIVEGEAEPLLLEAGDCVLLPNGRRFVVTKHPGLTPVSFRDVPEEEWSGRIATFNGGGNTVMLAGHFSFYGAHMDLLLGAMQTIVRLRETGDKEGLRWMLERMRIELSEARPGNVLVTKHLAHLVLVQALRLYFANGIGRQIGWLFALADPRLSLAIGAIHAVPGMRWTLPQLAKEAGMSRSKFAQQFKAVTGSSPIDYLTRWRMLVACDRLRTGNETISTIAVSLGYESESAFSTAFKRVIGCAPRTYGIQN